MAKKVVKYQSKSIVKPDITAVKDNTQVKIATHFIGKLPLQRPQPVRMKKVRKKEPKRI
tara:strand:+ start:67 stop:243 length:177 start_codon:yes stop_codon:yes gene_type:complete